MDKICEMCGVSNDAATEFCSDCGSPLPAVGAPNRGQAKERSPAAGPGAQKTMLFTKSQKAVSAEAPKNTSQDIGSAQTLMDSPMTSAELLESVRKAKAHKGTPATGTPTDAAAVTATPRATAKAKPKPAPEKPRSDNKTVLGMTAPQPAQPATAKPAPRKPPMAKPISSRPPKPIGDLSKQTVLGMPAFSAQGARPQKSEQARSEPRREPQAAAPTPASDEKPAVIDKNGVVVESPRTAPSHVRAPQPSRIDEDEEDEWLDDEETEPRRGSGKALVTLVIVGVVVILGAAASYLYFFVLAREPALRPQVFSTPDGNAVTVAFSFPEAPPGTAVRLGDKSVQLVEGQARVDLPITQLKIGTNEVQLLYLQPGQPPRHHSFPIVLRHLVTEDLSGLVAADPFILVNFQVAPGIQLAVEGTPVKVVNGLYTHRVPVSSIESADRNAQETLVKGVSFQISDAQGNTEQGQHVLTIPVTKLQIDRPADKAIVDTEAVTCAGITEEGAKVTVNGKAVGVTAVGFNASVALPSVGEHRIEVVARAQGKAPRTRSVTVSRIEDLSGAIAAWSEDLNDHLDYPKLAREPNAHVDKKIKLTGRIVNINTEKGVTVFLLYIAESCPEGARCAVYVVFRGETEAGLQSWVDVYGAVAGSRAVDLPSGEKLEVPAVNAEFVTKRQSAKKGNRRRR